ncbi:hypothetical protein ACMU_14620 [Actibacterium mucosum KCTC 23349]|uniref:AB hydrolase-1 domain-containing protein n=1 Tax=Actibacterium mucosum KCTC 23349 TaxID=1454373 RepID=A0A037ZEV3_9RHOB|nr:hypothetical protein [Actibacterium mucosum]KAJ54990.1 hypothetical protein ACMU_14620 [Actibacterium mucosum KCTC 23349]
MEETIGPDAVFVPGSSGHLVVVFGSLASVYTKTYEGYDFFAGRDDNALFIRDTGPLAFHNGFTGLTNNIEENVEFLKVFRSRVGAERTTFVGISSGGYAAILLGALLGIDDVIAVNPVTVWDPAIAAQKNIGERIPRSFAQLNEFYARSGTAPKYLDLQQVLADHPDGIKLVGLHYGVEDAIDSANAKHLEGAPSVALAAHSCPVHSLLAATMIEQGVMAHHMNTPLAQLTEDYKAFS